MAWIEKRRGKKGIRYYVCWDVALPEGVTTQKHEVFGPGEYEQALEREREISSAQFRGHDVDPTLSKQLFGPYARSWIDTRVVPGSGQRLRPNTTTKYDALLANYLNPTFEHVQIRAITVAAVKEWYNQSSLRSELQTKKAYRLLHAIMKTAQEESGCVVPSLPGYGKETHSERPLVDDDIVIDFAERIHPRLYAFVLTVAYGGLRPPGELKGLQREDINQYDNVIRVHKNVTTPKGGRHVGDPKTDAGKRSVAVPRFVIAALIDHMERFTGPEPDSWVFTNPDGGPVHNPFIYDEWRKTRKAMKLDEKITPYVFRHFALTSAARTPGMTLKNLMARGGHSSPRAALIYQHAAEEVDRSAADFLEGRVAGRLAGRSGEAAKIVLLRRPS